jgi:hypothetical protein
MDTGLCLLPGVTISVVIVPAVVVSVPVAVVIPVMVPVIVYPLHLDGVAVRTTVIRTKCGSGECSR